MRTVLPGAVGLAAGLGVLLVEFALFVAVEKFDFGPGWTGDVLTVLMFVTVVAGSYWFFEHRK